MRRNNVRFDPKDFQISLRGQLRWILTALFICPRTLSDRDEIKATGSGVQYHDGEAASAGQNQNSDFQCERESR
jgi:hypothetical protein